MTKQEATDKAIEHIIGRPVEPGALVATRDEPRVWEFISYSPDGTQALLRIKTEERTVNSTDIFDCKQLLNVANHYLNIGFYPEGAQSTIIRTE